MRARLWWIVGLVVIAAGVGYLVAKSDAQPLRLHPAETGYRMPAWAAS